MTTQIRRMPSYVLLGAFVLASCADDMSAATSGDGGPPSSADDAGLPGSSSDASVPTQPSTSRDAASDQQSGAPTSSSDAAPGTPSWKTIHVGAGGYLNGLDIAPDDTMVVRTDTYGAYLWSGTSWQQLITSLSMPAAMVIPNGGQGVYEIRIAPGDPQTFYMSYGGNVFQSSNKGSNWTKTSFAQVTEDTYNSYRFWGQKMAVDPKNSSVVYVGTPQNGLFATANGGANWQNVSAVPVSGEDANSVYPGITGIAFAPALGVTGGKTNTIFAASFGHGVYESMDAGATWSSIAGPNDVVFAAVSTSTGTYYAVGDDNTLWSYAGGAWTQLLSSSDGIETVAINPFNASEIVVLSAAGFPNVSYDLGKTWSGTDYYYDGSAHYRQLDATDIPWLANTGPFMSIGGTLFDQMVPNKLWTSDGVGVWSTSGVPAQGFTSTQTVIWQDQSVGIEQLVADAVLLPPGGTLVLASQDRPFIYKSDLNAYPTSYSPVMGDQIVAGWSIDYASSNPSFLVGIADFWGAEESGYSTNGGKTWTAFPSFISGGGTSFIGGSIAASSPTNIVWAPADNQQPYYTLDGGATWKPITLPGVSSWSGFDFAYYLDARTVTADRVLTNTFYLYDAGNGVYKTTDGGATWVQMFTGEISAYSNFNAQLASVPGQAGHLFFTGGLQSNFATEGFYRSVDGGTTWTAVPNVTQVNCYGFGAPAPGKTYPAVYIAGWVNNVFGVWRSDDEVRTWTQIGIYPNNSLDIIRTITGDPGNYGAVYIGFTGSGYAYYGP